MWANPNAPNLPDYVLWIRNVVGIAPGWLPDGSPFFGYALDRALRLVLIPGAALSGAEYTLAVYNCATHVQLKITPDQVVNGVSYTYFAAKQAEFKLFALPAGLVTSSSDQGTSESNAVPDALQQLTLTDLDFIRTPWGREFLAYQQDYGPFVWGLS